ncbi:MAG: VCBS repeat-containing protein [Polyangiaceae bacterium]|nr:VCBS repeat-containing protein [Polyangiaceae bacterium]MCB9606454.1 VCBS repeat-containing protein [Polyangiaceae bacterium]
MAQAPRSRSLTSLSAPTLGRGAVFRALGLTGMALYLAGCSCSSEGETAGSGGSLSFGGSAGNSGSGGSSSGGTLNGGSGGIIGDGGGGKGCKTDDECDGGVCSASGECCATAEQACGNVCCNAGEFCSFERCVVPGKACQTPADCEDGQYCETALGDNGSGGAGGSGSGGASSGGAAGTGGTGTTCTQPVPQSGRCVDLPPICDPNGTGGAGGAGNACIENCEYFPPPGALDPIIEWQWGLPPNTPKQYPNQADVWSTPTVARVYDANCDGKVDESDPPNVIFVSSNNQGTCCHCNGSTPHSCLTGVLRMLDGRSGEEIWSLNKAKTGNFGFAGTTVALGDVDGDERVDIITMTGDGYIAWIDSTGAVKAISDSPTDTADTNSNAFGWGGGISLGDMDGDGNVEVAYGRTLWSIQGNQIVRQWVGTHGRGGTNSNTAMSFFADVDEDDKLELVAGNTIYERDGTELWRQTSVSDGFPAVADFDGDGKPEVVLTGSNRVDILEGATGAPELSVALPDSGGGPPTVADFDGDGKPEIGVAQKNVYVMTKPNYTTNTIDIVWSAPNHDLSSNVTGSSVFDFDGDGKAEVIYADECFLWVYDGTTGAVLLAELTTSFTGTENALVADVDGDGHAEIVMVSNGADPSGSGWKCDVAPWNQPDPTMNRKAWVKPQGAAAYRGITVFGDRESSWVGTRTIWSQHSYYVTNICDSRDSACNAPQTYGLIPTAAKRNWELGWLNNFRQNVQDSGLFNAPDAVLTLNVLCTTPVSFEVRVQNQGLSGLPAGVNVGVFDASGNQVASGVTTKELLPGQTELLVVTATDGSLSAKDTYVARVIIDPQNRTFNECREDNNESEPAAGHCGPS